MIFHSLGGKKLDLFQVDQMWVMDNLHVWDHCLPTIPDQWTNLALIHLADGRHCLIRQWRQLRSMAVFRNLPWAFPSGDCAGNRIKHQDPPERKLAHRHSRGQHLAQLFYRFQANVVVDSRTFRPHQTLRHAC